MCIAKQKEAIKNCLKIHGYNSARVTKIRVNPYDRTLKVFKVEYQMGEMSKKYLYSFQILLDNDGIIAINSINSNVCWVNICLINALDKALSEKK